MLTQNYKAEYEKAGSAIITAVTRSGGNRFSGDVFSLYQNKALVQNQAMVRVGDVQELQQVEPEPTYDRWQWGLSAGGPIVQNKAQFFGSYEENRQTRDALVTRGGTSGAPAALLTRLEAQEGLFESPFREKLLFAKASAQPRPGSQLELTYNWRNETDVRSFGNQSSFQSAENVRNRVDSVLGKWQTASTANWLNEAYVSFQRYRWNPSPENPDLVGEDFQGLMRVGGRDTEQRIVQQRISVRDDLTRFTKWHGSHGLKGGAVVSLNRYRAKREPQRQPDVPVPLERELGLPVRGGLRHRQSGPRRRQHAVRRLRAGRLGADAAADAEPRAALGLRVGHAEQRLRDPGRGPRRDGAVRRRQPLLHRRQRSAALLRRLAAARRLLLRRVRQRPDDRVRRLGPLLRPRPLQLHARRALPPAVHGTHVPLLGRRGAARRQRDDRVGSRVPRPDRPRRPDRARGRAEPGGVPDRQPDPAADVGSVQPRRPPAPRRDDDLGLVRGRPQPQRLHVPLRQPPARRHVLPAGSRASRTS